jgi:hypothetical protein
LFIDGLAQTPGVYGAIGSGAANEIGEITGAGFLQVTSEPITENADFNGDGQVDGADFLVWQRGNGGPGGATQGDANGDSIVNGDDLAIWQSHYGGTSAAQVAAAVPEPTTAALAVLPIGVLLAAKSRRRR